MPTNLRALVVVLTLALIAFQVARPLCERYMAAHTFRRRRNVWLALTVVAFISPSFVVYAAFAAVLLIWATLRDENPLALYVLVTFVVPNVSFFLPAFVVNQLFELTQLRLLSLAVLIPMLMSQTPDSLAPAKRLRWPDVVLLAFLLLQVVLQMPYEAFTNTMRRTFLFAIDTFVVFYAFSRVSSRERIADICACFFMACGIMACIGLFESLKGWLLYTGLSEGWGDPNVFSWLLRGGSLRAQAAANHSINFGFHIALALGLYFYLRRRRTSYAADLGTWTVLIGALVVSYSRGALVTAMAIAAVYLIFRPGGMRSVGRPLAMATCGLLIMYFTPLKESILDRLPFIGTADQDTVQYRQRLLETSWSLIQQSPFFGDPFVTKQMESLRQGQGIIDIVNGYIFTALFTGLVGLSLLLVVLVVPSFRALLALKDWRQRDADAGSLGAALLACMLGALVYIATAGVGTTSYLLAALLVSYSAAWARSSYPLDPQPLRRSHAQWRPPAAS